MKKRQKTLRNVGLGLFLLVIIVWFYKTYSCLPLPTQKPVMGTHGWEVWSSQSFKSFHQAGNRFCVPKDWQPLGESKTERGGVYFPETATGILIKSNDFKDVVIPLEKSDFALRAIYPAAMTDSERDEYVAIAQKAFNDVGTLYPSTTGEPRLHTILITVGIAGDGSSFETSVYPRPSEFLSVMVRNKDHARGEDLFIHAATHAYNRFYPEFHTYQNNQSPVPAGDFEEMEASWSEITFRDNPEALQTRVADLYRTYEAVMSSTYSPDILFPFNDPKIFSSVTQKSVIQNDTATHGEGEFGHYVLAPLTMLAIEGLLKEKQSSATVDSVLLDVHNTNQNFFEILNNHLSEEEVGLVFKFIKGEEKIPNELLHYGLERQ